MVGTTDSGPDLEEPSLANHWPMHESLATRFLRRVMADETKAPEQAATPSERPPVGRAKAGRRSSAIWRRRARSGRTSTRRRRGRTQILPAQESLQVLRREDRRHQLQGLPAARAVCGRERQDCAAALDGRVRAAPAPAVVGYQTGAQHRAAAVCRTSVVEPQLLAIGSWLLARSSRVLGSG